MSRPKFIADADFNEYLIHGTRRRSPGVDFLTASEGGTRGLTDPEVLAIASATGRILVSHDRNTMIRHFEEFVKTNESPGLIIVRQLGNPSAIVESLVLIAEASEAVEWINASIFLPFPNLAGR